MAGIPEWLNTPRNVNPNYSSVPSVSPSAALQSSSMTSYQPSVASTAAGALKSSIDSIYNLSSQASARSEAQAKELRDWQEQQSQIARDFNASEAAKNRDWQRMMSDTAHQREIADLKSAGLNPVLSVMGGQGASTTTGATASSSAPSGAMGQTDMSATQALVSLLGTLWTSQTEVELQRASAENNLAIADKNRAAQESVAEIYGQYGLATQQLAGQFGVSQAQISGAYGKLMSEISAAASRYGSDMSYLSTQLYTDASKYAADMGLKGTTRTAMAHALTSLAQTGAGVINNLVNADVSSSNAKLQAEQSGKNSYYGSLWRIFSDNPLFSSSLAQDSFFNRSRGNSFGGRSR